MNTTLAQTNSKESKSTCCEAPRQATVRPRADIYEHDGAWFVLLEMPGVDEGGADVAVEKNVLTVSGEANGLDMDGFEHRYGEFAGRRFERSFRLPEDVDVAAIEARMKSGVLQLRLPKVAAALPHKVIVKGG